MSKPAVPPATTQKRKRGAARTTRQDWINAALEILITQGVDNVKIMTLAENLNCARSSFYWFFNNRADLLDTLISHWQTTNTTSIVAKAGLPTPTICRALINIFSCWLDPNLFDTRLDFAIREWARRSKTVRAALDKSDDIRLSALTEMFNRFHFPETESIVRARIVYFTQIGYYALDLQEPMSARVRLGPDYLYSMTGQRPSKEDIAELVALSLKNY